MATLQGTSTLTGCDEKLMNQFMNSIKTTLKMIKEFSSFFSEFVESQKKISKELWNFSTRYNILNAGSPCVYPMLQKDELLEQILIKIQDRSAIISQALNEMKIKYENLSQHQQSLQQEVLSLTWDRTINTPIKGSIKYQSPSHYLEGIADVLFQLDLSLLCMFQYFDALNLRNSKSFENLMNSFFISSEVVELLKEFIINSTTLLN